MVVFDSPELDLLALVIVLALLYWIVARNVSESSRNRSEEDYRDREESERREVDDTESSDDEDFEEIEESEVEDLHEKFEKLLDRYEKLIERYREMTDELLEQLEDKLAADAGYWKTTDMDFNWSKYENLIDEIDTKERQSISLVERFNQTRGWEGTAYESRIKDLIVQFETLYEERKEIRDGIEGELKKIYE